MEAFPDAHYTKTFWDLICHMFAQIGRLRYRVAILEYRHERFMRHRAEKKAWMYRQARYRVKLAEHQARCARRKRRKRADSRRERHSEIELEVAAGHTRRKAAQ